MEKKLGAGILLINSKNELLLLLRDDKQDIPFPNMWDLPGGQVEPGEYPSDTVKREINEEMGLKLENITLFNVYNSDDLTDTVFWKIIDIEPKNINLKEGQKIQYFSRHEISTMNLAFNYNKVVEDFFNYLELNQWKK